MIGPLGSRISMPPEILIRPCQLLDRHSPLSSPVRVQCLVISVTDTGVMTACSVPGCSKIRSAHDGYYY